MLQQKKQKELVIYSISQYTLDSTTQCSGDEVAHALLDSGGGRGYSGGGGYRGGGGGGGGGRRRRGSGGAVVKARGLPFSTTEYELAGFFEEYDVRTLVTIVSHSMLKYGYDSEESCQLSVHFIGASH